MVCEWGQPMVWIESEIKSLQIRILKKSGQIQKGKQEMNPRKSCVGYWNVGGELFLSECSKFTRVLPKDTLIL